MVDQKFIELEYPLHWLVWNNKFKELEAELATKIHSIEKIDNRGRTPLLLAVTLGHVESVRTLLAADANVNCESRDGWTAVQEAVATGDPELLRLILERRDCQRYSSRMAGIPQLLQKLKQAPDFYVEMKWEFTSWVPLIARMCPSDTYKVYKHGSNVRVDTTLLGFDHTSWQRGSRSYIFKGQSDGASMMELDHDLKQVYCEEMQVPTNNVVNLTPTSESLSQRLTTPIVTTYIDTDRICFERNKAGIWGWRSDKIETINNYECKVFSASNVELVTKTRTEHLTETDKAIAKNKSANSPLQSFLGITTVEDDQGASSHIPKNDISISNTNPCNILPEEYFDTDNDLGGRDIGRPKEVNSKIQKFKATLWLCENYPLSLQQQILPIVDLMAISSSHFAKLKNFIQMQLPSGFPVKIEIPLFHVLNARITFGNIFGMDAIVPNVTTTESGDKIACILDESLFEIPPGYTHLVEADIRRQFSLEEEDELLQFAIQQSLMDTGTEKEEVDIWEALKASKPSRPNTPNILGDEDRQLQRAIQASLALYSQNADPDNAHSTADSSPGSDSDLHMALLLSEQEHQKHQQKSLQEQQLLEEILKLSLTEK